MPNDVYLQPDAPDPVLTDAVVLGLVQRHVPDARAVMGIDESGGEARSYLVDDDLVLKTQRPHRLRPRTSLAKEAVFLQHMAAYPALPVPRVLGYGQAQDVEYVCLRSHPALDLRRWKDPADREALLTGHLVAGPVDATFIAVWRVMQIWADMLAIATASEYHEAAHVHLQRMLDTA